MAPIFKYYQDNYFIKENWISLYKIPEVGFYANGTKSFWSLEDALKANETDCFMIRWVNDSNEDNSVKFYYIGEFLKAFKNFHGPKSHIEKIMGEWNFL